MKETMATSPLFQLGYVPRSIDSAIDYWTDGMKVGPFFAIPHIPYDAVLYRDTETTIDCTLYIAYWGDLQIELVEQHCDSPSLYNEWLSSDQDGLHHICYAVDDIGEARTRSIASGGKIVQELIFPHGGGIYVDFGGGPGSIVEVMQAPPQGAAMFEMMKAAAHEWDGADPLRILDTQPQ